jgi:hypothetical protein
MTNSKPALAQQSESTDNDGSTAPQQVDDPSSSDASSGDANTAPSPSPTPELLAPTNTLKESPPTETKDAKSDADKDDSEKAEKAAPATTKQDADGSETATDSADTDDDTKVTADEKAAAVDDEASDSAEPVSNDRRDRKSPPQAPSGEQRSSSRRQDESSRENKSADALELRESDSSRPTRSILRSSRDERSTDSTDRRQSVERRAYRVDLNQDEGTDRRSYDDARSVPRVDRRPEVLPAPAADDRDAGRPVFGIYLRDDSPDMAIVEEVVPRSAAARAGVRADDVVLSLDDEQVRSRDDFYDIAEQIPRNATPSISVSRTLDLRLKNAVPENGRAVRATVYNRGPDVPPPTRQYDEPRTVRILVPAPAYGPAPAPAERTDPRRYDRREGGLLRGRILGR